MKKSLRLATVVFFTIGAITGSLNAFSANDTSNKLEDLIIINNTNTDFSFMGICGKGVVVKGNPEIKQQGQFTYKIDSQDANGEIGYFDNAHQKIIKLNYDYTKPGGYVTVKGGDQYYEYLGLCTLNGNEIIISSR